MDSENVTSHMNGILDSLTSPKDQDPKQSGSETTTASQASEMDVDVQQGHEEPKGKEITHEMDVDMPQADDKAKGMEITRENDGEQPTTGECTTRPSFLRPSAPQQGRSIEPRSILLPPDTRTLLA